MTPKFIDVQKEYEKNNQLKKDDVNNFINWINQQPHLPKINELQAILFLQSNYFRNEAAKTTIDTYFTVKTLCPEIYSPRNSLISPNKDTFNVSLMTRLPKKTPEGYTILFVKIMDTIPDKFNFMDQIRMFDITTMLHLYQEGTSEGHIIVFDMTGISFGHLTKLSPLLMKKLLFYLQEALPVRLKGLHFVNVVSFMDKILALMRPFMKKELMDVLYLHNTVDDLVEKVSRDCLPKEYGGTVDDTKVLQEKMKIWASENLALLEWEESQKVDESQRPGKPKKVDDFFGVEGTFKKLEID